MIHHCIALCSNSVHAIYSFYETIIIISFLSILFLPKPFTSRTFNTIFTLICLDISAVEFMEWFIFSDNKVEFQKLLASKLKQNIVKCPKIRYAGHCTRGAVFKCLRFETFFMFTKISQDLA